AALEVLQHLAVWPAAEQQTVLGENVTQALQFVASGNASLGLVAAASLQADALPAATCRYAIPAAWHAPIEQQAIVLTRAGQAPAALAFLRFLRGEAARRIIVSAGYSVPGAEPP
ncbi:MAG: molybdate ABC transporter substrate-binding protein, partial [Pseudomonadota bacterium]